MSLIVEQVYIFFYAVLAGVIIAFLYDVLRIKRRAIKTNVVILSIEDIIYWLLSAIIVFLTVYNSNDGQMRGFIFLGNILGVTLYLSVFSRLVIASSMMIINFIKKVLLFIWKVVTYPFRLIFKILSVPLRFIGGCFGKLGRLLFGLFGKAARKAKGVAIGRLKKVKLWSRFKRKVRKKT
ncbi:Spore cortex biosynthesis protein, YabQ-like protein [Ruminiclostridium papyrosolvens DSM 2782]|uniref:Spore cortex biosynthesis protein, YabQ-like protein n=1 Tax=Ruminiclostridium papyrosolvens DSM 2782 TaxID=588581 RepID=F1TBK1_9FIRM|nr:spore cortex biosynthesis protein YabQ [Ruminiclostridium papyrosolvens]EGD48405.1 Spore cortex biosynthesis protein, YabQ-like protein [Ruminiclostridium papyrosolvens DSM 2782]WES34091.1 spore cortex biosynthesis protein YabQ [Ruminiclostridium papyrosolvens DSM 2782]